MLTYHVWFGFQPEVDERDGISIIKTFLGQLTTAGKIASYRLLKNTAVSSKTRLAPYDACIEFTDDQQFATAFDEIRRIGIHADPHGSIIKVVCEFSADVFKEIPL